MANDVQIVIGVDNKGAVTGLKEIDDAAEKSTGRIGKLGGALADMGKIAGGIAIAKAFESGTSAIKNAFSAAVDYQKMQAATAAVIESTGGKAGITAKAVVDLANSLEKVTAIDDQVIQGAQNMLLTFTNIGKDVFPKATETVLNMSVALGQDAKSSAVQLGKALNDPINGITALSRVGVSFTEEQKKTIKAMVEMGDVAGAQKVILAELETEFGGAARAAGQTLGGQLSLLQDTISDTFRDIALKALPIVIKLTALLSQGLTRAFDLAERAIMAVAGPIADFARYMRFVNEDGDTMNDWLSHLPGWLQPIAKYLGESYVQLKGWAEAIAAIASAGFATFVDLVQRFGPAVAGVLSAGFGQVVGFFRDLEAPVKELTRAGLDKIAGYFNDIRPALEEFATGAGAGAVVVFGQMRDAVAVIAPPLKDLAEKGMAALADAAGRVAEEWEKLPDWAQTTAKIAALAAAFLLLTGPAGALLALGAAVLYVIGRWDELNAKFPQIGASIDFVKRKFAEVVDEAKHQFEKFNNDIVPGLRNVAIAIGVVVATFLAPFVAVGVAIEETIRKNMDTIKAIFEAALKLIWAVAKTQLELVRDVFSVAFALLRGDWKGAWDGIQELFTNFFRNVWAIAKANIDLLIELFKGIPALLLSFAGELMDVGAKLMNAVWDGMKSKLGDMKDWFLHNANPANWLPGGGGGGGPSSQKSNMLALPDGMVLQYIGGGQYGYRPYTQPSIDKYGSSYQGGPGLDFNNPHAGNYFKDTPITVNVYASGYVQDVGALADDIDRELRRRVA